MKVVPTAYSSAAPSALQSASDNIPTEPPKPWSHHILDFLGMRRLPDEEYLSKMKVAREVLLHRIEGLEREADEKRRKGSNGLGDNS